MAIVNFGVEVTMQIRVEKREENRRVYKKSAHG